MSAKANAPHTMDQFSAGRPIAGFNHTHTGFWIAVSAVLHLALILGTSVGYIRDTYVDPEGAAKRKAEAAEKAAGKGANAGGPTTKPAGAAVAKGGASGAAGTAGAAGTGGATGATTTSSGDATLDAAKNTPVGKRITDTAKKEEIPAKPDDSLGISLEETNKTKK